MTDGRVVVCCVSRLFIRMYLSRSRYASSLLLFLLHSLPLFSPLSLSYMHPSYINSSLLHLFLSFLSSHHLSFCSPIMVCCVWLSYPSLLLLPPFISPYEDLLPKSLISSSFLPSFLRTLSCATWLLKCEAPRLTLVSPLSAPSSYFRLCFTFQRARCVSRGPWLFVLCF